MRQRRERREQYRFFSYSLGHSGWPAISSSECNRATDSYAAIARALRLLLGFVLARASRHYLRVFSRYFDQLDRRLACGGRVNGSVDSGLCFAP